MNLRTINVVIKREYLNRVKKKSFLVTTFVVPILMAALCVVPILVMMGSKEKTKTVAVVDQSGLVMPYLENTETIHYVDMSSHDLESIKSDLSGLGLDAVLGVSELNVEEKSFSATLTSLKPLGIKMTEIWHWYLYLVILSAVVVILVSILYIPLLKKKKN